MLCKFSSVTYYFILIDFFFCTWLYAYTHHKFLEKLIVMYSKKEFITFHRIL